MERTGERDLLGLQAEKGVESMADYLPRRTREALTASPG
jgi:hypothetical protein